MGRLNIVFLGILTALPFSLQPAASSFQLLVCSVRASS